MARAVEWAGRAKSDLRLAVEYIRKDSPESAKAFLGQVFQATRSLSTFSEQGRVVLIMRVLHTSQDLLLALGRRTRGEAEGEQ